MSKKQDQERFIEDSSAADYIDADDANQAQIKREADARERLGTIAGQAAGIVAEFEKMKARAISGQTVTAADHDASIEKARMLEASIKAALDESGPAHA